MQWKSFREARKGPFGRHVFCCTVSGTIEILGKSRRPDFQRMRGLTVDVNVHIKDDHFLA